MKKFIIAAVACVMAISAGAELRPLTPSKPFDNYSLTLKGGIVLPLNPITGHKSNIRGIGGIEVRKQIMPALGLGIEGELFFNTSTWNKHYSELNAIDRSYIGAFGAVNLNNLFAGYAGQPRLCEVELVAGAGWLHMYRPHAQGNDSNDFATKLGININFNFGHQREWTISLKPSILFNMTSNEYKCYSGRDAAAAGQVGVTYHFGNSNGTHSFTFNECDYSAYNEQINALRAENAALAGANAELVTANAGLAAQLDECLNKPVPVITNTVVENTNTLESIRYVFYKIGSSKIGADQQPNVEMIADYMKHNPGSKVVIKGYASKDGNLDYNIKLAAARAESVKNMLINKYGIKASRIQAEGQGIGEMFKEESWNRVAICVLNEGE